MSEDEVESPRRTKVQHPSQRRGDAGERLVEALLPDYWSVRKVGPDFGLDFHIEVFDMLPDGSDWAQTAGEHLYAQVKTDSNLVQYGSVARPRLNVAKFRSKKGRDEDLSHIPVVSLPIEVSELTTIEAMGSSVPVLLFWVDLAAHAAYFVCMNDYIAKVLVPENPDYETQKTVNIRIPMSNRIDEGTTDFTYFWLLARRSKLYSLFNLFNFQFHELNIVCQDHAERANGSASETFEMIDVFVKAVLRLDVWKRRSCGWWAPLEDIHVALTDIEQQLKVRDSKPFEQIDEKLLFSAWDTFRKGANLGRMYEELVREWYLPTHLAELLR
ncbi:DUF4365 domain-containing protein [Micrococcus sp. 2A]|uniref:DUF4365 domain-containing protein n=1 Tax=Micrococcus sp. 2A TaxID=3142261 RepID=UPI0031BB6250